MARRAAWPALASAVYIKKRMCVALLTVLRLDVAVEHLAVVHMFHGEAELDEIVEHLVLWQVARALLLEQVRKVAALGKIHDNVQPAALQEGVTIADNVGMVE
jgi:hypothetical protein